MIRLHDATMLALTKLRTRKVRLVVTIVVSGLLFSVLAGSSFVARGVMGGIGDFGKEGLGERYITQMFPEQGYGFFADDAVVERALAIDKDLVARKKAEAKRLGIEYDPAAEGSPVQKIETAEGQKNILNQTHPAAIIAVQEYKDAHAPGDLVAAEKAAKPYGAIGIYSSQTLPYDLGGAQLQVLKDGKETFGQPEAGKEWSPPTGIESFTTMWSVMDNELLKPFILSGQNLETGKDGSVPIIVPNSAAEQLLGLKSLPASAKPAERLERTREIRAKAPSLTFSVCYRNQTSVDLVNSAVATKQDIEKNKNTKGYQRPSLIYGLPEEPCGSVPVTRDIRSAAEKTLAAKQLEFDRLFGDEPAEQQTMTFRIVGIVPDADYGTGAVGVGQIIRSLVTSSLGNGWYTPSDQLVSNPLISKLFNHQSFFSSSPLYYAEFATAGQAKKFIEKQTCAVDLSRIGPGDDPGAACAAAGTPFHINAFGSNSVALDDAKRTFGKVFGIAALIVSAIAGIIMMGTVGRMIADSRRETAVFRAIGAKKLDIAQIYITYVVCLSLLISLFALITGLTLALLAHNRWSPDLTIQAITAYNAQDLNKTFPLYAFYIPDILILAGLALASGLLSASIPLFRNLRRNPIRDMRDDT